MSTQTNEARQQGTAKKSRKSKRKAKSPLLVDSGQTGSEAGGVSGSSNVNKRIMMTDHSFVGSPINSVNLSGHGMTSPGSQFQQFAYGTQLPHGQILYQSTPSAPPSAPAATSAPPPWALKMMDDINLLKESIPKIDNIEKTAGSINMKINEIESKMKQMEGRITETEKSCEFIGAAADSNKQELSKTNSEVERLRKKCETLDHNVRSLETEKMRLGSKITELESRSMRDNLVFYGVPEDRDERCEEKVTSLIRDTLSIADSITFDRVHRVGAAKARGDRPIVAKFHYHQQREQVRQKAFSEREALKRLGYGVGVQYPKEVRDKRKLLYPVMKREEQKGKTVRLVNDRLYINNVLYNPDNDPEQMT